jgi:Kef-type K+ transport system membrane component KefB
LDDAVAVLIFVIGLAVVRLLMGGEISLWPILEAIGIEIGVAIAIGIVLGTALSYLTRYLRNHEDIFIAAVGLILLCGGIAEVLGASLIMACMILGVTFTNLTPREGKLIQDNIESVIPVIFVIFFVTAGLELQPALMMSLGLLGVIYVISRIVGKHFGAYIGCISGKTEPEIRNYLGLALLSQAGVAIGLAIIVSHELRGLPAGETLGAIAVSVITATTVIFEIIGPIGVRFAVTRVQGQSKKMEDKVSKRLRRIADEVDVFESDVEYQPLIYTREKSDIDEIRTNMDHGAESERKGSFHDEN